MATNLLCLDTSTNHATLAVGSDDSGLLAGLSVRHDRSLSTTLYDMIGRVLTSSGLTFQDIDIFACGIGPGSFTGVRVAVTTMRTLAHVTQKRLVGVPTLDISARMARRVVGAGDGPLCVALASRRDEVYSAIYERDCSESTPKTSSYTQIRQLSEHYGGGDWAIAGPAELLETIFADADKTRLPRIIAIDAPAPLELFELSLEQARLGRFQNPLALDPMYVAPPAVSQHKQLAAMVSQDSKLGG